MSDMWAAASKDIEAERKEQAKAFAAVALGKFAPFLFEAKTKSEFITRMALQQTKIAEALEDATEDEDARKAALDQMTSDFDDALESRQVEAKTRERKDFAKSVVAKAVRKSASGEVVQTDGDKRVIDMGENNPLSPRYKIEKNWGEGGQEDWQFESFSNDLPKTSVASRRTAANEIAAGDYIVAKGGLPDLRDGQSRKVMLTTNHPGKVTKIETFDEAFPKGFQRYDWIDAKEKFETFLGTWDDSSFDLDNHGDEVWVAHLDSGEIVPLDAARHYSDRFPTRSNGPQVPGQKSWNFAHREAAERLPLRIKMAGEERLPLRIKMANPYSDANPYAKTPQQAPAAPAPQVTVNVAPRNDKDGPPTAEDTDDERQRRAREKINQTQMTQDLTASRERLALTLAGKILKERPGATKQQALRVAKATMDRHPALVSHALSRMAHREPKESSPR